jgi:hypothetical protein
MRRSPETQLQASFNRAMTWASAFATVASEADGAKPYKIVHGPTIDDEGPLAGLRRVTAWLEVTGLGGQVLCIQMYPRKDQVPRRTFYEQMHVQRSLVCWYSFGRALALAKQTRSTGPWHEKLIEIQTAAQYRLPERQGEHDV